jgi:hypothetical protein
VEIGMQNKRQPTSGKKPTQRLHQPERS